MDYRADHVFAAAAAVAAKGWKVVKLYGVKNDCTCTCHLGNRCPNPGKHPSGDNWPARATSDEEVIGEWFNYANADENLRVNVGVKLGRDSGIIDIEFDSPEAEAALKRYGLDQIDTPTYTASRGCHRIFRWEDDLPDVAVVKVDGIEVRLGGGGKAAQSVMPSSWHRTGIQYSWLPGRSIDEVDPAPLPAAFKAALKTNSRQGGGGAVAQARQVLAGRVEVTVGNRHGHLVGVASWLCGHIRRFTPEDLDIVTNLMLDVNKALPQPKDPAEAMRIAADQFEYYRLRAEDRRGIRERPLDGYGLEWNDDTRQWDPGEWTLTIVHSDPIEYRLTIPYRGRQCIVSMDETEILNHITVAQKILKSTARIDLMRPYADAWKLVWMGGRVREGDGWRDVESLRARMLDDADEEQPSLDSCLWSQHAAILRSYLRPFGRSDDEDEAPYTDGTPKWIKGRDGVWRLYFKWQDMIRYAWANVKPTITTVQERELKRKILLITGERDFKEHVWKRGDESLGKFKVWTDDHIAALDQLTGA